MCWHDKPRMCLVGSVGASIHSQYKHKSIWEEGRKEKKLRVLLALSSISVACCWTRSLAASSSHSASFWRISTISEFWVTSSNCLVKSWRRIKSTQETLLIHTVTRTWLQWATLPSQLKPAHCLSGFAHELTIQMDLLLTSMNLQRIITHICSLAVWFGSLSQHCFGFWAGSCVQWKI